MDFKSILNKLDSMDAPVAQPAVPELPQAVQLNEDAQLRVLSGRTTYVTEAKKKAEEEKVDEEMHVGDKKTSSTGGTIEKTKTGVKHTAGKNYSAEKQPFDKDAEEHPADKKAKKAKKESVEPQFKSKFMQMVEAAKKAKPDFADLDKDGDKKEPMKKAAKEAGNKPKKGVNPFAKKTESAMMPKGKKRPVKESVETKLTFKEMIQLVQESGGQQQIDPVDAELFAWAQRVASTKFNESVKAELYAGVVYERMGGVFEMYDVLSEDTK